MKKFKKYKHDLGISLLEVIFALGIMASLTPVVVKFAFKDLSDIKYLNLAKKIKQLTKSVVAYSAKIRNDWGNDTSGVITKENLNSLHLADDVVDSQIINNSYIKYIKDNRGEVNVYGVVDLNGYSLDQDKFKKTLLYVEDNIGYVVDDVCGACVHAPCVCSINNDWAISYNDISSEHTDKIEDKLLAVVRIDENLLRKDYLKDFYLYRNSQGGDTGNVMQRDLSLGGNSLKDIVTLFTQSVSGKNGDTELIKFKTIEGKFFNNISIKDSFIFSDGIVLTFLNNSIVEALNIYFQRPVTFDNFSAANAILRKDPNSRKNQTIKANKINFAGTDSNYSMSIVDIVTNEVLGMDKVVVNGELATIDAPHIQMDTDKKLKTKIFNVNNKLKIVTTTKTLFDNLKAEMQTKFRRP